MKKIKIVPKNSTADVNQIYSREQRVEIDKAQAPFELTMEKLVLTPVVRLSKQTGTHSISTDAGYNGNGSIDDLIDNLRNFGIDVNVDGDDMVFTNRNSQPVTITLQAQGRSGRQYQRIPQENTSIDLDGKNATFTLAPALPARLQGFRFRLRSESSADLSKSASAYTYNAGAIGTNGEKTLNLSNFIDELGLDAEGKTAWSKEMFFDDVNHQDSNGGVSVIFAERSDYSLNLWIDMRDVSSLSQFADKVADALQYHNIKIEYAENPIDEEHIPIPTPAPIEAPLDEVNVDVFFG